MPVYEVELSDGRIVDIEGDKEPSHEDVEKALSVHQPLAAAALAAPTSTLPEIKTQPWQESGADLGMYGGYAPSSLGRAEHMREAVESLTTPNINLPTFRGETGLGKVAAGVANVLGKGIVEPATSLYGAALLGGATSPIGRAAFATGYGIPMIREGLQGLEQAKRERDFQHGVESSVQALLGGAMLGLPKGESDAVKTRIEPESDLIQHPRTEEVGLRPETSGGNRPAPEPAPQEEVTAATFTNPETGETTTAPSHEEAAEKQGVKAPEKPEERHGPEFGFEVQDQSTGATEVVSRPEGEQVARESGQLKEEPKREEVHSDEIAMVPSSTRLTESHGEQILITTDPVTRYWRATRISPSGTPINHWIFRTREDALESAKGKAKPSLQLNPDKTVSQPENWTQVASVGRPDFVESGPKTTITSTGQPDKPPSETDPKLVGLGGALHEGEISEGTGLKNAVADMERAGLGLEKAPETVKRNMANAWSQAGNVAAADPTAGEKLAADLISNPERGLTDADSALLLRHKVELWNKMNDAAERSHVGDETSRERAQTQYNDLLVQFNQLLDAVKQRGSEWGREGRWRQAMAKEDFTFTDTDQLNRYHRTLTGQDLTPQQMEEATQVAGEVKAADTEATQAAADLHSDLDRKAPRPTTPDMVKAERDAIDAANKTVREAAIRVADAEAKARVAKTVEEKNTADLQKKQAQDALDAANKQAREGAIRLAKMEKEVNEQTQLNDQAKAAKAALDAANKTVRENAVKVAAAEAKKRIAQTAEDKKTADIQLKAEQKALAASDKVQRDAARALAQAQRKLRGDPIKAVWTKVREQIDRNPDQNFDDLRSKVAAELGMKPDQVGRLLAQDATTKRLMDDAWNKQQRARLLKQEAKRWVAGVDEAEWIKLGKSIPRIMFGIKTFGHFGVPLGTHAPMVAFDPRYAHLYFPAYKKMWQMALKPAFWEQQVQDLKRRPNYIQAQRGGVVNNPDVYEDYTNPAIAKYFLGTTGAGVRSFTILKILRQDMFDMHWDKLPRSMQTDAMAKAIAQIVNPLTGVITDPTQMKGRPAAQFLGQIAKTRGMAAVLFAPKLEASRAMTLALDPMRATWILTKSMWSKVSPDERFFAMQQVINKSLIAGTLFSLLKLNDLINQAVGSNQKVNTSDPMRSDFLKFKVAGMDFAYGNAMISMFRMPLSVYRVIESDGGKTKSLVYADESIYTVLGRFGRTQLSPFMGTLTDLGLGSDYASRPLPRALFGTLPQNRPVPKRLQAEGLGPYSWPEYWSEQAAPIPFQEAVKEFWRYGFGMNPEQMSALEKAVAISSVMGATGGRLTEDVPPKKKSPLVY